MAHLTKMKLTATGNMMRHYEREGRVPEIRENVDETRTHLNYTVGDGDPREMMRAAVETHNDNGRALRSDAVVLADWVITAPRDLDPGDERRFFHSAHDFCVERYGEQAVPRGYVHMDEATPHMHQPVVPLTDEGRLQASIMLDRHDLQTFHHDLSEHVERDLGYRVSIELPEAERGRKQLSHLSQDEFKAARDELAELRQSRDGLRQQRAELERTIAELKPVAEQCQRLASEARELEARRDGLRDEADGEERRLESLRPAREAAEGRVAALEREVAARRAEIAPERTSRQSGGVGRRIARSARDGVSGALGARRGLGEREQRAAERNRELAAEKGRLVADCGELERQNTESETLLGRIGDRIKELEGRVGELRERVAQAMERAEERLRDWYREQVRGDIGRDGIERGYDPPTIER